MRVPVTNNFLEDVKISFHEMYIRNLDKNVSTVVSLTDKVSFISCDVELFMLN